jgi:ATP-dependent helicase/nuclease subunit B
VIQRVFLGWDEPLLPLAARFLCERYAGDGVADLQNVCAVLPGARAGRRLKELLFEEALRSGLRLVPPRVVSVGALAELLYPVEWPFAEPFLLRQLWSSVLHDADAAGLTALFGELPEVTDVSGWSQLGARAASLQHEVAGGGFTFGDVARICGSGGDLLFDDSARWKELAKLQAEYRQRLAVLQVADPDLERIDRLAKGQLGTELELWLIGIVDLPTVVARILEKSTGEVGVLVHAPVTEALSFDALGLVDRASWRERELPLPDESVRVADRPGDQAAAALEEIARLGEVRSEEVVIAQTSEALVPYLREWLEAAGLPVHYAGGRPIESSRPYRLLVAIRAYLQQREWEELAGLVRHIDLATWLRSRRRSGAPDASPEVLDRLFCEHLPAHFRRPAEAIGSRGRIERIPAYLSETLLAPLLKPQRLPLAAWPDRILAMLAEVYSVAGLSQRTAEDRRIVSILERIRSVALHMHRLPGELSPACGAADAIGILLEELRSDSVPDEPEGAPIEILGWLELALDDAPHAVVVGVNEGDLPQSVNAHPFLPDRLRTVLGLQNNDGRYARDAFHLLSLLHSRESVSLITGRLGAAGDPLRPSRLLLATPGETLARRILTFTGARERGTGREAPLVKLAARQSHFSLPPVRELIFTPPTRLRVTDFKAVLRDPYRWVLERRLALEAVDDRAREMDGLAFGSLAHEVLAGFGTSAERDSGEPNQVARRLDALLDEAAYRRFGPNTFPAVHLQVEHLRARLRRFAEWQAQRVRNGWRMVLVEGVRADGESSALSRVQNEAAIDVDGEPLQLTGRIDRVDHHPTTGRWALLDYKTSNTVEAPERAHRKPSTGEWKDLQLPLYRHLAAVMTGPEGEALIPRDAPVEFGYVRIPKDLDQIGDAMAAWTPEDLDGADEAARDVVRWLRNGVARFDAERVPTRASDGFAALFGTRLLVAAGAADRHADAGAQ